MLLPIVVVPIIPPSAEASPICSISIIPSPAVELIVNASRCSLSVPPIIPWNVTFPSPDEMVRPPLSSAASTVPPKVTGPPVALSPLSVSIVMLSPNSSTALVPPIAKLPASSSPSPLVQAAVTTSPFKLTVAPVKEISPISLVASPMANTVTLPLPALTVTSVAAPELVPMISVAKLILPAPVLLTVKFEEFPNLILSAAASRKSIFLVFDVKVGLVPLITIPSPSYSASSVGV